MPSALGGVQTVSVTTDSSCGMPSLEAWIRVPESSSFTVGGFTQEAISDSSSGDIASFTMEETAAMVRLPAWLWKKRGFARATATQAARASEAAVLRKN